MTFTSLRFWRVKKTSRKETLKIPDNNTEFSIFCNIKLPVPLTLHHA
jgi:hypothetical protein